MAQDVYFNIWDGHCKIWGYDAFVNDETRTGQVITYYGRVGVPMHKLRKHEKHFEDWSNAYGYVRAKVEEKLSSHGYESIENWRYFGMIHDGKPLSEILRVLEDHAKQLAEAV